MCSPIYKLWGDIFHYNECVLSLDFCSDVISKLELEITGGLQ
jgi:hypothetical protein